jgi:nucleoside transporter
MLSRTILGTECNLMAMSASVRFRLSTMMFLLYAVWGSWAVVAYPFFQQRGFSDVVIGWLFSMAPLACILAPFFAGQIVDRWMPTQFFLAAIALVGGVLLVWMGVATSPAVMLLAMGVYSLLFAPTLPLTNSLAFHHMKDPDREFGGIRVFGTIGWIAAGVGLTLWRHLCDPAFKEMMSGFSLSGEWFARFWDVWWQPSTTCVVGDLFFMGGVISIVLGLFCLILPHTPPKREGVNPLAFVEALKLLKDRNFLVFLLIAFVVTTELNFYYIPTPQFLADIGISSANVPSVMAIAQIAEIIVLAFILPTAVKKLGLRWTLALGVIAWPLRYIIFAFGEPTWLVVASLAFHGFGYAFFFVASQIYVNNVAHSDIRASAQSLFALVTVGLGMWLGAQVFTFFKIVCTGGAVTGTGWFDPVYASLKHSLGTDVAAADVTNWTYLFLVPCALTASCAIAYLLFFKPTATQLKVVDEVA